MREARGGVRGARREAGPQPGSRRKRRGLCAPFCLLARVSAGVLGDELCDAAPSVFISRVFSARRDEERNARHWDLACSRGTFAPQLMHTISASAPQSARSIAAREYGVHPNMQHKCVVTRH